MKTIRRPAKQKTRPRSQQRRVKALPTPPGFADVRLCKGEVHMLRYSIFEHSRMLRKLMAQMEATAVCLENCAGHVQKLIEPEAP